MKTPYQESSSNKEVISGQATSVRNSCSKMESPTKLTEPDMIMMITAALVVRGSEADQAMDPPSLEVRIEKEVSKPGALA